MKLIFAGTPAFALPSLRALAEQFHIAAVLTQPDKPQGRKGVLTPPPVKAEALARGIPVLQPEKLKADFSALAGAGADLMVTCAYGQILTQEILDLFPLGVWNVHASLLPAYRGAAPIARAILGGEKETGVTIMKTDVGLDTGDMFLQERLPISDTDTCGTLTEKLASLGAKLICEAVSRIQRGDVILKKQGEGQVCGKVSRTPIDFTRPAEEVSALIRGLSPAPLAYGVCGGLLINCYNAQVQPISEPAPAGMVVACSPRKGLVVACGEGAVRITELQPAGGKRMADTAFANGGKLTEGARFDQPVL